MYGCMQMYSYAARLTSSHHTKISVASASSETMSLPTFQSNAASDIQSRINELQNTLLSCSTLKEAESVLNDTRHSKSAEEVFKQASELVATQQVESSLLTEVDEATRPWRKASTNDRLYRFTAMCNVPGGRDELTTYGRRVGHRCASASECMAAWRQGHLEEMMRIAALYNATVDESTFDMNGTTIKDGNLVVKDAVGRCKVVHSKDIMISPDGEHVIFLGQWMKIGQE
jgi:hypothetical protein